jgi:hypothetical protein
VKFREDRPLAEMRAAGVRGEHLAPRPVPRQAAEYFSSVPVGDRTGEVSIQRYCHLAVLPPRTVVRALGVRKPARWSPFTGGFSREYLNVAGMAPPSWGAVLGGTGGCRAGMTDFPGGPLARHSCGCL